MKEAIGKFLGGAFLGSLWFLICWAGMAYVIGDPYSMHWDWWQRLILLILPLVICYLWIGGSVRSAWERLW